MKKIILSMVIYGLLVASLAAPAAAGTSFGPNPVGDISIVPDLSVASKFVTVNNDPLAPTTAVGISTSPSGSGQLEAKLMIDVNNDGDYSDVETDWATTTAIKQKDFNAISTQTNIKVLVKGTTNGDVFLFTSKGPGLDTNIAAEQQARVTIHTNIPEFPTIALPVAGVLGLLFVFGRKKEGL